MNGVEDESRRGARYLNPFAFPAETEGRFRMLMVAALVLAWSLPSYMVDVPNPYTWRAQAQIPPEFQEMLDQITDGGSGQVQERLRRSVLSERGQRFLRSRSMVVLAELTGRQLMRLGLSLCLVGVVLVATVVVYRAYPAYVRRRDHARLLVPEEAPTVLGDLRRAAGQAGLSGDELSVHCSDKGSLAGLALGPRRAVTLLLYGPPAFWERAWKGAPQLRAILLHELGHVANGDLRNHEASRALWVALAGVVLVASVASLLAGGEPVLGPPVALTLGVVWWLWAELVRIREFYADWRAASWGAREALVQRLRLAESHAPWWRRSRWWQALERRWPKCLSLPATWRQILTRRWPSALAERGPWRWLAGGWRYHPTNAERRAVLGDPGRLFRMGSALPLLTGILLMLVFGHMAPLVTDLILSVGWLTGLLVYSVGAVSLLLPAALMVLGMMAITYLVTGALGVQAQREAMAGLATGAHGDWGYLRLARPALLFALGLEVGGLLTPLGTGGGAKSLPWTIAWALGFTGLMWIWLIHNRALARWLLGAHGLPNRPRRLQRLLTLTSTVLLAALFWPALWSRLAIHVAGDAALQALLTPSTEAPGQYLAVVFVMTSLMLLVVAMFFFIVVSGLSLLVAALRLAGRGSRCATCGAASAARLVVGRPCPACGEPLAPWLYLQLPAPGAEQEVAA